MQNNNNTRAGLALIKRFEGCELKAYKCPAGVWTIGYGRTTNVKAGDTCTQAQADAWLIDEYDGFERRVQSLVNVPLTAEQLGALTCFVYNIGIAAFQTSTLLKKLNAKDYDGAASQFYSWTKAGGKVLQGLVKRRAYEVVLFKSAA